VLSANANNLIRWTARRPWTRYAGSSIAIAKPASRDASNPRLARRVCGQALEAAPVEILAAEEELEGDRGDDRLDGAACVYDGTEAFVGAAVPVPIKG
jgi:hypothetical protein